MNKRRVAVLISGRGSNLQSLIDACKKDGSPAQIAVVISNNPDAQGLKHAAGAMIPTAIINHKEYASRQTFEQALSNELRAHETEFVVLAGFMRVLTASFVNQWYGRMINIHPSLLPAFRGAHAHRDAIAAGVKLSGCTVHFVSTEMDAGPIIMQAAVPVFSGDTEETLAARVLTMEHRCLPHALKLLVEERLWIKDNRVYLEEEHMPLDSGIIHPFVS